MLFELLLVAFAALVAWYLTGRVRRYALASRLLDRPNERSSHLQPTPRGGGLAIVAAFTTLSAIAVAGDRFPSPLMVAVVGGAMPVAAIGWYDDRGHVAARWRLLVHVAAAGWAIWFLGPAASVAVVGGGLCPQWLGWLAGTLLAVWMVNLYNFMDGIDGIAGIQAATVALGAAIVGGIGGGPALVLPPLLFAATAAGFLVWNLPPAKIFMGDVGSGFLGMVLAILAVWAVTISGSLLWSWLILTAAFMTDATVTLVRRVLRGEKFYLAHRSHAYQYASRLYKSHKVVALAFGAINVFWLFPWALAVALGWVDGALALLIAYAPLVLLAFHYKAGDRAGQGDLA